MRLTPTVALLDADIVAYKLAAAAQQTFKWPGQESPSVVAEPFEDLRGRVDAEVQRLAAACGAQHVVVCLSCPAHENWRLKVLPTYKANRIGVARPVHLEAVKDYLAEAYPSYRRPTLEADDIMGILSTMGDLPRSLGLPKGARRVIVSEDKDMESVPGFLFNPRKDRRVRKVTKAQADWWHMYQTLVGDPTDNYGGCPRMGPVKARALLPDPEEPVEWGLVVEAYNRAGRGELWALTQARVARICRSEDYDFGAREVRLWTP